MPFTSKFAQVPCHQPCCHYPNGLLISDGPDVENHLRCPSCGHEYTVKMPRVLKQNYEPPTKVPGRVSEAALYR